jgi:hypothetical protein
MNPYVQFQQMQDQQGLAPVFQNIAAQQAMQNAALNEQNQQVMQAGQTAQGGAGANQLAMAMALRKKNPSDVTLPSTNTAPMSGVSGMGNSMGTGLTQDSFNSGIGFNPYAQTGGFGLKY